MAGSQATSSLPSTEANAAADQEKRLMAEIFAKDAPRAKDAFLGGSDVRAPRCESSRQRPQSENADPCESAFQALGRGAEPLEPGSHAAALRGTAAVVRDGRDVADERDLEARRLQGAERALAAGAGALHED